MTDHEKTSEIVLREMVRLAENRRTEELEAFDRLNRYNLSLIAFDAGFLSLMITAAFPRMTVAFSGLCLLISILLSLLAVRPRVIKNAGLSIEDDVRQIKEGIVLDPHDYFLETAELTEAAAVALTRRVHTGKQFTIYSALFLATALLIAYSLSIAYA